MTGEARSSPAGPWSSCSRSTSLLQLVRARSLSSSCFAFDKNRDVDALDTASPRWFGEALHDPAYIPAIETSLKIAAIDADHRDRARARCAALALARMKRKLRVPFDVIVYLTLVVPEIVIAVASLIFFVQAHEHSRRLSRSSAGRRSCSRHVVFNTSLVMLIVRARFVGMGSTLEEASFDLGAGPLSTFRQVTLPRLLPAIVAGGRCSRSRSRSTTTCSRRSRRRHDADVADGDLRRRALRRDPGDQRARDDDARVTLGAIIITAILLRRSRVKTGGRESARSLGSALGLG